MKVENQLNLGFPPGGVSTGRVTSNGLLWTSFAILEERGGGEVKQRGKFGRCHDRPLLWSTTALHYRPLCANVRLGSPPKRGTVRWEFVWPSGFAAEKAATASDETVDHAGLGTSEGQTNHKFPGRIGEVWRSKEMASRIARKQSAKIAKSFVPSLAQDVGKREREIGNTNRFRGFASGKCPTSCETKKLDERECLDRDATREDEGSESEESEATNGCPPMGSEDWEWPTKCCSKWNDKPLGLKEFRAIVNDYSAFVSICGIIIFSVKSEITNRGRKRGKIKRWWFTSDFAKITWQIQINEVYPWNRLLMTCEKNQKGENAILVTMSVRSLD
jgi:hypothetical protein